MTVPSDVFSGFPSQHANDAPHGEEGAQGGPHDGRVGRQQRLHSHRHSPRQQEQTLVEDQRWKLSYE